MTMLGNMKVSGTSAKEPTRLTKSPMNGNSAVTKMLKPKMSPLAKKRRVRKAAALMSTAAQRGRPSSLGRYSDTDDPYAQ
nr:unnamed protein product [Digitaria exilis]